MPLRMSSLRDLDRHEEYDDKEGKKEIKLAHIPTLIEADTCQRLLNRIYGEFYPIIQKRGYNVTSISEMCCCGDGMDHCSGRKRKLRTMSPQVHGYNMTQSRGGKKVHSIHLRMRDPNNHAVLFGYEHVAGTMAHELAHCVHGAHSAAFYKLMDEILGQHAVFMSQGIVADKQGFPMGNEQAYTLGGSNGNKNGRNAALEAAQRRMQQQQWMPQGPQRLGGDGGFRTLLGAREAAGQAAEARRLRDEVWCQPCQESDTDTVELDSDSDEADDRKPAAVDKNADDDDGKPDHVVTETESDKENATNRDMLQDVKPSAGAPSAPRATSAAIVTIDLTGSDDDDNVTTNTRPDRTRRKRPHQEVDGDEECEWSCTQCTFKNLPGTLVCGMCGMESQLAVEKTKRVVAEIRKTDKIEQVKRAEVEHSVNEFGFNIYGNGKQATAKLPHLT